MNERAETIADCMARLQDIIGSDFRPLTKTIVENLFLNAYHAGYKEGFARAEQILEEESQPGEWK